MLKIEVIIDEINYVNLVGKLIPEKWFNPIAKAGIRLLPSKDKIMIHFITKYRNVIINKINTYCVAEKLPLYIRDMELKQVERGIQNMLRLDAILDEINYNQVIETILPKILENLSKKEDKQGEVVKYLIGMGTATNNMVTAALDTLSQEEKDEMVSTIINIYKEDIVKSINCMIEKQNISSEVSSLHVGRLI